jgi:exodeoxyribonuclease V alpha subunit
MQAHLAALNQLAGSVALDDPAGLSRVQRQRDRLLVLAPTRRGPWGLEALHRAVLGDRHGGPWQRWPAGTPVLCTRNRPELALANGDVGVLLGEESEPQRRRLLFGERDAEAVLVHPAQLAGACEPALAMTIHKAQGSEADEVIVLMPPNPRPERRLLYTALTRARRRALLITAPA